MSLYKRFSIRGMLVGALITSIFGVGAVLSSSKQVDANSVRNCDSNAVIYCGALSVNELITKYDNSGDSGHHYSDIHALYSYFGISSTGIHSLASKVAIGQVHKDGTVWLNGVQIGQNALTAGRINFPGSTPVPGTGAFMRHPSVSFRSNSINAYIGFVNGVPAWAILDACGNPVKFDHPKITLTKQVQDPHTHAWVKSVTVNNGDTVHYLLTVRNSGSMTDRNVKVADLLPAGQTYVRGSTKVNGHAAADGLIGFSGVNIGTLAPGASATITFDAKAAEPASKCGLTSTTNFSAASADNVVPVSDTAGVKINVACIGKCSSLVGTDYDVEVGQKITFKATATTQGLTVVRYAFKIDGKIVQDGASNTYVYTATKAGTFTFGASMRFSDGTVDGDHGNCVKQVTVHELPPVITCDSLTADKSEATVGETITFKAKGSATNAKILSYIFKVDGVTKQNTASDTYAYTTNVAGDYTVSVTVHTDHGDATSNNCVKQVTFKGNAVVTCDSLTADKYDIKPGEEIVFTAKATATNATITGYTFKVNDVVKQDAAKNTYVFSADAEGTYIVSVIVQSDHGPVTSSNCVKKVHVHKVVRPILECDGLSRTPAGDIIVGQSVTLRATFTATGGATFKQAQFDFGDGSAPVISTKLEGNNVVVSEPHTYSKVGNFTITAKLDFLVDGQVVRGSNSDCVDHIKVGTVVPPVLPNTGAGDMLGIFAAVTAAGAISHKFWSRRLAR